MNSSVAIQAALAAAHAPHRNALQAQAQAAHNREAPPLASPCIGVCQLDAAQQHCIGCLRNLQELQDWGRADAAQQRQIWQQVLQRAAQLLR